MDLFFGYDSHPEVNRDTLLTACREIKATGAATTISWEELKIKGRVIITRIFDAIDEANACGFDVSTLNENVMFELGYAIARGKFVWILVEKSDPSARKQWSQFRLLKDVGYLAWKNVGDIKAAFFSERPDLCEASLYDDLIEDTLPPSSPSSLFYVPTFHSTEPSVRITRRLDQERHRGIHLSVADPTETAIESIEWYASHTYQAAAVVVHFEANRRELASLHNARSSLIAGLACGFDRPTLMLAEQDYSGPLDYDLRLKVYSNTTQCVGLLEDWLTDINLMPVSGARTQKVKLASELRTLRFGEPVAENEAGTLDEYFVETAAFDDVLAARDALFVGRKGSGKTANMLQAAAELSLDARNLVVVIKPASYEFTSLVALLGGMSASLQQYFVESLWRFLLVSEVARKTVESIEERSRVAILTAEEEALLTFVDSMPFAVREDFGLRFESTIQSIADRLAPGFSDPEGRDLLNESLHTDVIARLRSHIGPVLKNRRRVAILIDNLDKGWDRRADLDVLSNLLLGLLAAIGRVARDFQREDSWRDRIALTMALFLRADIYMHLQSVAREPDKLPISRLHWDDAEQLIRVIEERFLAPRPPETEPAELWDRFICPTVKGVPTREYVLSRCLPRPRDLIYFFNAMSNTAANRRNELILEADVLDGENLYSQFAFEALLVENGVTIEQMERVLFEFLGEPAIIPESTAVAAISNAGIAEADIGHVLDHLKALTFLGVETAEGRFEFSEEGQTPLRSAVLARKTADARDAEPRVMIHPAYRSYLEIREGPLP